MRRLQTITMIIKEVKKNTLDSNDNEGMDGGAQN
jgi:hypothetical protein